MSEKPNPFSPSVPDPELQVDVDLANLSLLIGQAQSRGFLDAKCHPIVERCVQRLDEGFARGINPRNLGPAPGSPTR
jgi:hypothetical protein